MRTYKSITIDGKQSTDNLLEYLNPWLTNGCEFENADIEYDTTISFGGFVWNNGIWKAGTFKGYFWENGIFEGGTWKGQQWRDGIFKNGVWDGGNWISGTWKNGVWYKGTINGEYSKTPPTSINFNKQLSSLKTNQISLPKEIRIIKDPTLYSIADILVRM